MFIQIISLFLKQTFALMIIQGIYIFWVLAPYQIYMFGKHLLSFCRLPLHFVDGLFCHTLTYWFDVVTLVFCFFFSLIVLAFSGKIQTNKQKIVANTDVKELTPYVYSELYCLWFLYSIL